MSDPKLKHCQRCSRDVEDADATEFTMTCTVLDDRSDGPKSRTVILCDMCVEHFDFNFVALMIADYERKLREAREARKWMALDHHSAVSDLRNAAAATFKEQAR